MPISIADITVDTEFEQLLPPLSSDELKELMLSCLKDGYTDPLIVWLGHGILVDGHNRFRIWTDDGADEDKAPVVVEKAFTDRSAVKEWMLRRQLARRNLTDAMRVKVALQLKPMLEAQAKAKQARKPADSVSPNSDEQNPMRVDAEIAKAAKVGKDSVRKVEAVLEKADEPTKAAMLSGDISISKAHETVSPPKPKSESADQLAALKRAWQASSAETKNTFTAWIVLHP